ncbi:MAG: type II toxin-antitoxin system HicB family antitoxin [Aridibacter sp.]
MEYSFTIVIEKDEDAYHAFVPALSGCHSFGDTIDEARQNISEALELHLEVMIEDGETIPIEKEPFFVSRLSIPIAV